MYTYNQELTKNIAIFELGSSEKIAKLWFLCFPGHKDEKTHPVPDPHLCRNLAFCVENSSQMATH